VTLADPARLAAIHAASFTNPRPWSGTEIASLLSEQTTFLIADAAGFALGRAVADEAELLTLAVSPALRRAGTGARLLTEFLAEAARRGAATIFLEVAADNDAALALYRRHGFSEAGRRRGYYRDSPAAAVDAIVMRRALAAETGGN
jgi:[ribosomal protein S18]-alanine N-acetyltransferase